MRNFNEHTLTGAALERLGNDISPRTRKISESLIKHLHAFVRDIEPSQEEWETAIDFLTRTGHTCSEVRQEFILLSDALGVSMLVDAINHRLPNGATETTVLGPFYVEQAPLVPLGSMISNPEDGPPLRIVGTVTDVAGQPLPGATVAVWHADDSGYYDVQKEPGQLTGRAKVLTDSLGRFELNSVVPHFYPIPNDGPVGEMLNAQGRHPYRPAHVHFMISLAGYQTLVTHLFLEGDPYLDSDVVFGVKDSLIVKLEDDGAQRLLSRNFSLASH